MGRVFDWCRTTVHLTPLFVRYLRKGSPILEYREMLTEKAMNSIASKSSILIEENGDVDPGVHMTMMYEPLKPQHANRHRIMPLLMIAPPQ